jgi:hypothetical protein
MGLLVIRRTDFFMAGIAFTYYFILLAAIPFPGHPGLPANSPASYISFTTDHVLDRISLEFLRSS